MMTVEYRCPKHGVFGERKPIGRYRLFVRCPECGKQSVTVRTLRKPDDNEPPNVWGDVRREYFSSNLNRVVGSRRDIRETQKVMEQDGFAPMGKYDIKSAVENAHKRAGEAADDLKWYARETEAGRINDSVTMGAEPE